MKLNLFILYTNTRGRYWSTHRLNSGKSFLGEYFPSFFSTVQKHKGLTVDSHLIIGVRVKGGTLVINPVCLYSKFNVFLLNLGQISKTVYIIILFISMNG